jgi:hypothetical protein
VRPDLQGAMAGICKSAGAPAGVFPVPRRQPSNNHLVDLGWIGIYSRSFVRNTVMNQAAQKRYSRMNTRRGGVAALPRGAAVPEDPVFQKKSP